MQDSLFSLGFDRNQTPAPPQQLKVDGEIPGWLRGTFIRNGPGLFYLGKRRFNHWFDGLGMLHQFNLNNGEVIYQSKFLDCHASQSALDSDELTYSEFATDPCWSLFGRMRSMFEHGPTDSAKVNLAQVGEKYFALGETTMQIEFDRESLATVGTYNFNQPKFGTSSTAHPHFDNEGAINMITKYGPLNRYQIMRMDSSATKLASVTTLSPSYMHSFGMSDKYYVLVESPYQVNSIDLIARNRPFITNFKWNKRKKSRVWVISRSSGKVVCQARFEPCFFFHFVNTFDGDGKVGFDLVTYPDAGIIEAYYLKNIESHGGLPGGKLTRFTIDLKSAQVTSHRISEARIELPQIHTRWSRGKVDYRYVYAPALASETSRFYDQLVKIDIQTGSGTSWQSVGCFPGEPVFVAAPGCKAEDDGVLLSLVLDANQGQSYLLVLNARTMQELCRVHTPEPVLFGFHGSYFSN